MDFSDQIEALAERARKQVELIKGEEATKNALVMPFIQALGYNVFDPTEVVPEFTADVGTKKGEKVDYALMREGQPSILFECKAAGANLEECHASQLFRYFSVTPARIAVLTNGTVYRFYSDLEEKNKMDARPFLVFDLFHLKEDLIQELKRLSKESFDLDEIISVAGQLKYTRGIRKLLEKEMEEPSEQFLRHFVSQVYSGRFTQSVRERFAEIVRRAFQEVVRDTVTSRLQSALEKESPKEDEAEASSEPDDGIVTTEEELEGFQIVRAILSDVVDPSRVQYKDRKTYFAIQLDGHSWRPLCRLWFNTSQKYLGLLDAEKNERREPIDSLTDIFKFSGELRETVGFYESS